MMWAFVRRPFGYIGYYLEFKAKFQSRLGPSRVCTATSALIYSKDGINQHLIRLSASVEKVLDALTVDSEVWNKTVW